MHALLTPSPLFSPALLKAVKGHVPELLRHPCGAPVLEELYNIASASQRDTLAAEFYGKEYVLFDLPVNTTSGVTGQTAGVSKSGDSKSGVSKTAGAQVSGVQGGALGTLLASVEPLKRKNILRVCCVVHVDDDVVDRAHSIHPTSIHPCKHTKHHTPTPHPPHKTTPFHHVHKTPFFHYTHTKRHSSLLTQNTISPTNTHTEHGYPRPPHCREGPCGRCPRPPSTS